VTDRVKPSFVTLFLTSWHSVAQQQWASKGKDVLCVDNQGTCQLGFTSDKKAKLALSQLLIGGVYTTRLHLSYMALSLYMYSELCDLGVYAFCDAIGPVPTVIKQAWWVVNYYRDVRHVPDNRSRFRPNWPPKRLLFTARCTLVRSYVVCPSVCPSVC